MDLAEKVDPATTAVVVIDMQNDFCSPGGYLDKLGADLSGIPAAINGIRALLAHARQAGASVVHVRSWFDAQYLNRAMLERLERLGIDPYVVSGTWGAEFVEGLEPEPQDTVVTKHAYSAFHATNLREVLEQRGVRTVILGGTATNVCVDATGRDAFYNGFYVVVPPDATSALSPQMHEYALTTAKHGWAVTADVSQIADAWRSMAKL